MERDGRGGDRGGLGCRLRWGLGQRIAAAIAELSFLTVLVTVIQTLHDEPHHAELLPTVYGRSFRISSARAFACVLLR